MKKSFQLMFVRDPDEFPDSRTIKAVTPFGVYRVSTHHHLARSVITIDGVVEHRDITEERAIQKANQMFNKRIEYLLTKLKELGITNIEEFV